MRGLVLLPGLSLLAACGGGGGSTNEPVTENQIERVSTPKVEKHDPSATARLQPLRAADVAEAGQSPGCHFNSEGRMLVASVGATAVVRIQDQPRRLASSAPLGPTGGFFSGGELSVSIGRTSEASAAAAQAGSWPARITVTNRRTEAQQEMRGVWTCAG